VARSKMFRIVPYLSCRGWSVQRDEFTPVGVLAPLDCSAAEQEAANGEGVAESLSRAQKRAFQPCRFRPLAILCECGDCMVPRVALAMHLLRSSGWLAGLPDEVMMRRAERPRGSRRDDDRAAIQAAIATIATQRAQFAVLPHHRAGRPPRQRDCRECPASPSRSSAFVANPPQL
jgi:hypothetical protein